MIIPINTDAPIYHYPISTAALIVANLVVFGMTAAGAEPGGWILLFGDGLHPWQWFACHFLHFGFLHLIGNMIFLWGFGLVIEGKLGWWRFLLVYLGIGALGAAMIQVGMLGSTSPEFGSNSVPAARGGRLIAVRAADQAATGDGDRLAIDRPVTAQRTVRSSAALGTVVPMGVDDNNAVPRRRVVGAGGASLVIFGLLAMAVVWAPRNEVQCLWFFGLGIFGRGGIVEIQYLYFGALYIGWELLLAFIKGSLGFGSQLGHLVGAVTGFAVGIVMLKLNWVDCENWDLLAVWRGTHGNQSQIGRWGDAYVPGARTPDSSADRPAKRTSKRKKKAESQPRPADSDAGPSVWTGPFGPPATDTPGSATSPWKKPRRLALGPLEIPPEASVEDFSLESLYEDPPETPPEADRVETDALAADPARSPERGPSPEIAQAVIQIRTLLKAGNPGEAASRFVSAMAGIPGFKVPESVLGQLARELFKQRDWKAAIEIHQQYLREYPDSSAPVRIRLGRMYLDVEKRPRAALDVIELLAIPDLPDTLRTEAQRLQTQAREMLRGGQDA